MGRNSTGAITTSECKRIDINHLLKDGYIKDGLVTGNTLSWTESVYNTNTGSIGIIADFSGGNKYIRLLYETGKKGSMDYMIFIEALPSNLGIGERLYFHCPVTW